MAMSHGLFQILRRYFRKPEKVTTVCRWRRPEHVAPMRKCRQKDLTGCNQSVVGTAPNSSLNISGFGTDYRISIKLADFMVILRSIVFFAECLKPSYSTLVIKNGGIIISGIFQGIDK